MGPVSTLERMREWLVWSRQLGSLLLFVMIARRQTVDPAFPLQIVINGMVVEFVQLLVAFLLQPHPDALHDVLRKLVSAPLESCSYSHRRPPWLNC